MREGSLGGVFDISTVYIIDAAPTLLQAQFQPRVLKQVFWLGKNKQIPIKRKHVYSVELRQNPTIVWVTFLSLR